MPRLGGHRGRKRAATIIRGRYLLLLPLLHAFHRNILLHILNAGLDASVRFVDIGRRSSLSHSRSRWLVTRSSRFLFAYSSSGILLRVGHGSRGTEVAQGGRDGFHWIAHEGASRSSSSIAIFHTVGLTRRSRTGSLFGGQLVPHGCYCMAVIMLLLMFY